MLSVPGLLCEQMPLVPHVCHPMCRSYNANSGDTGGLVMPDWQTLNWQKLTWLQDKLRLKSWYLM